MMFFKVITTKHYIANIYKVGKCTAIIKFDTNKNKYSNNIYF